jgi:hypothetical protein
VPGYAAVAATMPVVDAWFEVLNAGIGADLLVAASIVVVVHPLVYLCWLLSARRTRTAQCEISGESVRG